MNLLKALFRKTEETSPEVASKASWILGRRGEMISQLVAHLRYQKLNAYADFLEEYHEEAKSCAGSCLSQTRGKGV